MKRSIDYHWRIFFRPLYHSDMKIPVGISDKNTIYSSETKKTEFTIKISW